MTKKSPGYWLGWSIGKNNWQILTKLTNPTGPRTFFRRFFTHKYNSKRIFYSDQIWSSTDWLHFWGSRPLCSSRLRLPEKSLVDQLPWDQNLLRLVLSLTTFFYWRPLMSIVSEWHMIYKQYVFGEYKRKFKSEWSLWSGLFKGN